MPFTLEKFEEMPIVGIMRNFTEKEIEGIVPAYVASGLKTLEITMNTKGATSMIANLVRDFGGDLQVGAGTVCTQKDLDEALKAGAQFIVTPILDENVIAHCKNAHIPIFAGAFTPTEIYEAWAAGASMVKVFPATRLGPEYIKEVKAPLNQIKLLPTGGVGLDNLETYLKAKADGFGLGGQLFDKQLIDTKNWQALQQHFEQFVAVIRKFKKG